MIGASTPGRYGAYTFTVSRKLFSALLCVIATEIVPFQSRADHGAKPVNWKERQHVETELFVLPNVTLLAGELHGHNIRSLDMN